MRFAICNELFEGWPFDEMCRFVKDAGYEGVELAPFTLAPRITDLPASRRAELRSAAAAAGIEIIGLHWLLAGTEGLYLTSPDPAVRARTADYLVALAEAARDLGGDLMVFGSPKQRSLLAGVSHEQAFDWASDVFRRVMPAVADCGVTICMEPLAPTETDFINTCADGARLVDAVGHPNFALHLDVKAMCSEPTPMAELIRRHAPTAGHFHANDSNLRGPGFGDVDFVPIFSALARAGYDRWVSVEVFDFKPDPETIAKKSIDYMRRTLAAARKAIVKKEEVVDRAYVLIEAAPNKLDTVRQALGRLSMSKAVMESLWPDELIAHIQGNDAKSLTDALTNQLPRIEGVARITVWAINQRD